MLGGATRHMLPHLPGVPHLHANRLLDSMLALSSSESVTFSLSAIVKKPCPITLSN